MIDKEQIKMSIEKRSCIGLQTCHDCPALEEMRCKSCFAKNGNGKRLNGNGLRPRVIRILQQWLDENY